MPTPPVRAYSFTNWQVNNPTAPPPGDRLDGEYDRTNASVASTITWASVSLNTDGTIRDAIVNKNNLVSGLFDGISQDIIDGVQPLVDEAGGYASAARTSSQAAQTAATAADTANVAAQGASNRAADAAGDAAISSSDARAAASAAASSALAAANDAENATGAEGAAYDYAILTQAWAEHMPDTIPPNILAVMGITGDHWSSRWWANRADVAVSTALDDLDQALDQALEDINAAGDYWLGVLQGQTEEALTGLQSLYLGAFASPPVADSFGNDLATGAMYFDLTLDAAYVWNGTAWRPLVTPGPSATFRYVYVATAGQTVFSGPDRTGNPLVYDTANYQTLAVFHVGLLLTPTDDYAEAVNTVTLTKPAAAGDIVQLLVESVPVVALDWRTVQLDTSAWTTAGGVLRDAQGHALTPNAATDVMLSVDGVWQQGSVDYAVSGSMLTFTPPAEPNARCFGLVIVPSQASEVPVPGLTVIDTASWVFDGAATAFPLRDPQGAAVTPQTAVNLLVSLNGVWQAATRDYAVSASTVTFAVAPEPTAACFAVAGLPALMTTE